MCECVKERGVGTCEWGFYSGRFWGLGNENDRVLGLFYCLAIIVLFVFAVM